MENSNIKKVAVIGPESTGKSSLCAELSAHYKTGWVREFAREYLETNGTGYSFDDLKKIAAGQVSAEDALLQEFVSATAPTPVFMDTNLYVIKTWSEFVFNKIDNSILSEIAVRPYDLYLLCAPDLPWTPDELREYPDEATRRLLFEYYKEDMVEQKTPWTVITGENDARFHSALRAINSVIY